MTNSPTDSIKTLAARFNLSRANIRSLALDLQLSINYSPTRRTYFIDADARTIADFNSLLADRA